MVSNTFYGVSVEVKLPETLILKTLHLKPSFRKQHGFQHILWGFSWSKVARNLNFEDIAFEANLSETTWLPTHFMGFQLE